VLTEVEDGLWTFPSVIAGNEANDRVTPGELIEAVQEAIAAGGGDPADVDPRAPQAGLKRWAAVAYGALLRTAMAKPQEPERRKFAVNSDGERAEYRDATVELGEDAVGLFRENAPSAADFEQTDRDVYSWVSRSTTGLFSEGESLGQLRRERGRWHATANSPERLERLLDRIEAICGERPQVKSFETVRPWEQGEPFAEHEAEDTDRSSWRSPRP